MASLNDVFGHESNPAWLTACQDDEECEASKAQVSAFVGVGVAQNIWHQFGSGNIVAAENVDGCYFAKSRNSLSVKASHVLGADECKVFFRNTRRLEVGDARDKLNVPILVWRPELSTCTEDDGGRAKRSRAGQKEDHEISAEFTAHISRGTISSLHRKHSSGSSRTS
ncbi:hypothetical protein AXG93_1163s1050 [Marchantia polymorpha subsp. ruderalis]|uniref:Uncharacterized protein n=1 Tax=Marchantia polymorpha subsp. ruderalis TaxID=1480154 RepID=A0A176VW91_MARPO|nr:hypothetical protein AXG93_1163s1050 [Marchantia polymorpha subsp. ruderalis]